MAPGRRRAAVLLALAALANAAFAPCAGWDTSARARMACCAGAEHECSQAAADDCCLAGEQREHGEKAAIPPEALAASPVTVAVPGTQSTSDALRRIGSSRFDYPFGSPPDTHLLLSVFLI